MGFCICQGFALGLGWIVFTVFDLINPDGVSRRPDIMSVFLFVAVSFFVSPGSL